MKKTIAVIITLLIVLTIIVGLAVSTIYFPLYIAVPIRLIGGFLSGWYADTIYRKIFKYLNK